MPVLSTYHHLLIDYSEYGALSNRDLPRKMYSLGTPVFSSASLKAFVHGLVSSFSDVSMLVRTSSILLAIFSGNVGITHTRD